MLHLWSLIDYGDIGLGGRKRRLQGVVSYDKVVSCLVSFLRLEQPMFVKHNWNVQNGKRYDSYHVAESYRDEDGVVRHNYLMNLNPLPQHAIDALDVALDNDPDLEDVDLISCHRGDSLRGAGQLLVWRAWKKSQMDRVLSRLSEAQRRSVFAMACGRITDPCSKLALKEKVADTFWARMWPNSRLDEDQLYMAMDALDENWRDIQKKIARRHASDTRLYLYDTTSTYFEGREAEGAEYGKSKDHRWDRRQVVIGVVTTGEGIPLGVEVWPGNTNDVSTVRRQVEILREEFGVEEAVFVGDKGMYSEQNLEDIADASYDYIIGLGWRRQQELLREMAPEQLGLFDRQGLYEWQEDGVRYVGCRSEQRRWRAARRRREATKSARDEMERLKRTAFDGAYYTERRLWQKVQNMLEKKGVGELWKVDVEPLEEVENQQKVRLKLKFRLRKEALRHRKRTEGKYVLATTVEKAHSDPAQIVADYKRLMEVESGFRHIKSYLKVRPIYHWKWRRIRAHVLVCFLSYYLVKCIELQLREAGIEERVETLIERWDKRELQERYLDTEQQTLRDYGWGEGQIGRSVAAEIRQADLAASFSGYVRGIRGKLLEEP